MQEPCHLLRHSLLFNKYGGCVYSRIAAGSCFSELGTCVVVTLQNGAIGRCRTGFGAHIAFAVRIFHMNPYHRGGGFRACGKTYCLRIANPHILRYALFGWYTVKMDRMYIALPVSE